MHETPEDIDRLGRLIERSHAQAGGHLRSIFDEPRRIAAAELPPLLQGVQVLNLATVTSRCQPRVAPVDGLFYRGDWYFGTSRDSLRFRHFSRRPEVSASHTRGEELAVLVHGRASEVDLKAAETAGFRSYLLEVYVPLYGEEFERFADANIYARLDAERFFTFRNLPR